MIDELYYHVSIIADRIKTLEDEISYFKSMAQRTPIPLVALSKYIEKIHTCEELLVVNYEAVFSLCDDSIH